MSIHLVEAYIGPGAGIALVGSFLAVGSALLAGSVRPLLVGIAPRDPITTLTAVTLMVVVAALGVVVPALRALGTDPREALSGD